MKQLLVLLEKKHQVHFSYLDNSVENILTDTLGVNDLDEKINQISKATGLLFEKINETHYSISKADYKPVFLCGYIKDDLGNPLPHASIISNGNGTSSDENGFFQIMLSQPNDSIQISFIGYETQYVYDRLEKENECYSITMLAEDLYLKPVLIADFLTRGVTKVNESTLVINNGQMGVLPGMIEPDVLHTLQNYPGVTAINEAVSDLSINGGSNDQNLLLWNGIRLYQTGHFFGLITMINPYLIKSTTLIKNATPAEYGNAVSGTILLESEDELVNNLEWEGGINMLSGDFIVKSPLGTKATINISGRRSYADLVVSPTYNSYYKRAFRDTEVINSNQTAAALGKSNNDFNFSDVSLNFIYKPNSRTIINLNGLHVSDELYFQENAVINNIVRSKESYLIQSSRLLGIEWLQRIGSDWFGEFEISASNYFLEALNVDISKNIELKQKNEILDFTGKIKFMKSFESGNSLILGMENMELGIRSLDQINNPNFSRDLKNVSNVHSFFFEYHMENVNKRLGLDIGLRNTYLSPQQYISIEPRALISFRVSQGLNVELNAERKTQFTSQIVDLQSDFLGIEKRRWILSGKTEFPLIVGNQVSAGFQWNKKFLTISTELFYKTVEGINSQSQGFTNQFQYTSTSGGYQVKGINSILIMDLGNLNIWTGYSLMKNSYEFNEFIPPSFPNNMEIIHTNYLGLNYLKNNWEMGFGINAHTGKPYTGLLNPNIENFELNFDSPNSKRLTHYLRSDFSIKYQKTYFQSMNTSFGFSLWNIFDRNNLLDLYYNLSTNNSVTKTEKKGLGITPNAVIRVRF